MPTKTVTATQMCRHCGKPIAHYGHQGWLHKPDRDVDVHAQPNYPWQYCTSAVGPAIELPLTGPVAEPADG